MKGEKMEITKVKKIVRTIGASSLMVLFLGVGSSYASIDIGGGNECTGPNSENENIYDIGGSLDFRIDNRSEVNNELDYSLNSGRNLVKNNTCVGDISWGDVSGDIEVINDLSWEDMDIDFEEAGDIDVDLVNDTTGPNSINTNEVNIDNSSNIDITNDVVFNNEVNLRANTGRNTISRNTCVGDIIGGDIDIDATIENIAGFNDISLPNFGDSSVDVDFMNSITGPCSENSNVLNVDSRTDFELTNTSTYNNDINVNANTGNNTVSSNTCVGDVRTGDANINLRVINGSR